MEEPVALNQYDKSVIFLLYGLFAMPLLPKMVGNIVVGLFFISCVIHFFRSDKKGFNWSFFGAMSLLYLTMLASLIYSDNLEYGVRKVGTSIPLLLFPLAISLLSSDVILKIREYLKNFIKTYVGAVMIIALFTYYHGFELLKTPEVFHRYVLENGAYLGMDALYLSFHLAIALIGAVYLFYLSKVFWKAIIAVVIIVVLFILLLLLSFKSTILAFVIAFGLYAVMVNKVKLWSLFIASTIVVVVLLLFALSLISSSISC